MTTSIVGPLKKIQVTKPQIGDRSSMMTGKELANCGLRHACGPNTFPVHMFTGKQKRSDAGPKICVNGKYVLAEGINDAGRGFNIAVIDPVEIEVIRVGHFDTYAEDSSHLEIFLEMITEGEIILAITYDDAARKLSDHAKHLLNELGSAQVQNMRFRDNWYFIGQKGVDGFVDREQLEYSGIRHEWPNVIDKRMCVPTKLQGFKIKPDPLTSKNPKRREFCTKYEGYDDFCDVNHMDELLAPAPLTDRALQGHVVFLTPIAVVIKDMTGKALQMLLDTILMQPGVDPKIVYVMHDKEHPDAGDMASVYGFHSVLLDSLETFPDYMNQGMDKIWSLFPKKSYVMMIEEAVVLSPDYLYFMAQILPMLKQDETLIGISAWNPNGYEGVSSNISLLYRIETIPGLAFLMKRTFYERKLKGRLKKCCRRRSWEVWKFSSGMEDYEMVVPDISRVQHLPVVQPSKLEAQLFNRKRVVNLEPRPELAGVRSIIADRYEEEIFRLIRDSKPMSMAHLKPCRQALAVNNPLLHLPGAGKVYVLYFNQRSSEDYTVVALLCKCSGLFFVEGVDPFGLHKGMLRFTLKNNVILFIGSASPYFVYKPPSTEPIGNEFFTGNER